MQDRLPSGRYAVLILQWCMDVQLKQRAPWSPKKTLSTRRRRHRAVKVKLDAKWKKKKRDYQKTIECAVSRGLAPLSAEARVCGR